MFREASAIASLAGKVVGTVLNAVLKPSEGAGRLVWSRADPDLGGHTLRTARAFVLDPMTVTRRRITQEHLFQHAATSAIPSMTWASPKLEHTFMD
jgi:hypothetical protein